MDKPRKNAPRGVRNHNPCNIRINPANKWQGKVPVSRNTDGEFEQFEEAVFGLRAAAVLIINHATHRKAETIAKLIRLWAPASENDTVAYIARVARLTSFKADERLDFRRFEHLRPVLLAMIRVENGRQPYDDATIDKALAMAGVEPTVTTTIA